MRTVLFFDTRWAKVGSACGGSYLKNTVYYCLYEVSWGTMTTNIVPEGCI